ncbi:hypothetical protein [Sinorhizobium alkalisoli]|uniref:Uncharacterized protein n=1 Tax=Sinorhizobium alkalisoli TaxID=1752398 RepID=A0A1E3VHC3_9HYPH|nr:hypothetical protein [Sinorhizobium alkalisoli]MCA1492281.1 hypothetical protein [Ensifer sp. NBAIM29]MCG5481131.1 hypothetical protein [Sinorhizobium alkalisoli]ODR92266.1 hypothetical protein A8M32_05405 [Sinorhizobium alkalisoli]QFI66384.1 hypothetical protein EKH55_1510 [Sinorhizobium alkalisoli]
MTQVVTVSATTAAYAAEAVKPSARIRGDGPADEAITLLSARPVERKNVAPAPIAKAKGALCQALMLISAERRTPQESAAETMRRYLEFMQDEEGDRGQADDRPVEPEADEEQETDEFSVMLEQFIQRG